MSVSHRPCHIYSTHVFVQARWDLSKSFCRGTQTSCTYRLLLRFMNSWDLIPPVLNTPWNHGLLCDLFIFLEASKNSGRLNKDRHLRMPGTCSSASELKSIASLCLAARPVFFSESKEKTENDDSLSMRIINFGANC